MASLLQSASRVAASSARAQVSRAMTRLRTSLTILLAANAILIYFLFRAPGASETDRRTEIARLEVEERATRQLVERLRGLRQKVEAATQNERQFAQENFLQRSSASSRILEGVDRLARQNNLKSGGNNFSTSPAANELGWTSVTISMSVEGQYTDLVRFINQMEQSPLFWIVQSLDVSGESGSQLRLNLQAATYLLPS